MTGQALLPAGVSRHRLRLGDVLVLGGCIALLISFMTLVGRNTWGPPPDFAELPVDVKKQEFFVYLTPMVAEVNAGLARDRDRVAAIREAYEQGQKPEWRDRRWLARLAEKLEVPVDEMDLGEALATLERRAGTVPQSLVLAQAAIESGWGTSRFAQEGNNYFGQRCYEPGCGMSPLEKTSGSRFGLARFDSAASSVESYILNLNTHSEYRGFRLRRQALRDSGAAVTGLSLIGDLAGYSERGSDYIAELRAMIRSNSLE